MANKVFYMSYLY